MRSFLYVIIVGWIVTAIIDHSFGIKIVFPVVVLHKAMYLIWGAVACYFVLKANSYFPTKNSNQ